MCPRFFVEMRALIMQDAPYQVKELQVKLVLPGQTKSKASDIVQSLAEKLSMLDRTQIWIFGPNFIRLGKFSSKLLVKEVTEDIQENNGWIKIALPSVSRLLYEESYRIVVVTDQRNLHKVRMLMETWARNSLDRRDTIRINNSVNV